MANVLLVGAFGQGNPGDEALCSAFVELMAAHDLVVASADPSITTAAHGVPAIPASPYAVARAVRGADAVVIGGGTIFKTLHPSTGRSPSSLLRNTAAVVALARASGTSVAMAGVGAGDLVGGRARRLTRWIVPRVDLLILRDEESAAVLADAGVPPPFWIGADLAWLVRPPTPSASEPTRSVTVAVSHLAGDDALVERLAGAVAVLDPQWRVRLQPWQRGGADSDRRVAERLRDALARRARPVEVLEPPAGLAEAVASVTGEGLVIAMRFHALVAAAMAGTRTLAIAHEPKLAGVARRLDQLAVPVHASVDVVAAAVRQAIEHGAPSPAAVRHEIRRAEDVFTLVDLLLADGHMVQPERIHGLPLSSGSGAW